MRSAPTPASMRAAISSAVQRPCFVIVRTIGLVVDADLAAVDRVDLAGDVARAVAHEERDERRHVLGLAHLEAERHRAGHAALAPPARRSWR